MTTKKQTVKTPPPPFHVGQKVSLVYRVEPFYTDEILEVDSVNSNNRSGSKREYRIRVISTQRPVSGWVYPQDIQLQA